MNVWVCDACASSPQQPASASWAFTLLMAKCGGSGPAGFMMAKFLIII